MSCQHCNGTTGVWLSIRLNGWASVSTTWDGEIENTEMDEVRRTYPKTGRCQDCGRYVPNPVKEHKPTTSSKAGGGR